GALRLRLRFEADRLLVLRVVLLARDLGARVFAPGRAAAKDAHHSRILSVLRLFGVSHVRSVDRRGEEAVVDAHFGDHKRYPDAGAAHDVAEFVIERDGSEHPASRELDDEARLVGDAVAEAYGANVLPGAIAFERAGPG